MKITQSQFDQIPLAKQQTARQRRELIFDFEKFWALQKNKRTSWSGAIYKFSRSNQISATTLRRWLNLYREGGLVALVDRRGSVKTVDQIIDPQAFDLFRKLYLTRGRLSVRLCWEHLNYVNQSKNKGWKIPCLRSMYQIIKKRIPKPVITLHREGMVACRAKYGTYISQLVAADCSDISPETFGDQCPEK